jgi:hypothetical protein
VSIYFDRQGAPIDRDEYLAKTNDHVYTFVAGHSFGRGRHLVTLWLGLDYSFGAGTPLIFESAYIDGPRFVEQRRYSTEAEARAGHERMRAELEAQFGSEARRLEGSR